MMIRQVSVPISFEEASQIIVPLQAPSLPKSLIVTAVKLRGPNRPALRISDGPGGSSRYWKCGTDGPPTALWFRLDPRGDVTEVCISTVAGHISGIALAGEFGGCTPAEALTQIADLMP